MISVKFNITKERSINAAFNTIGFNFISKGLGYIRMILIASIFSLNMELDHYFYLQSLVFVFIVVIADINDITLLPKLRTIKDKNLLFLQRSQYFSLTFSMVVGLNLIMYFSLGYILTLNGYQENEIEKIYLIFYSILPVNVLLPLNALLGVFLRAQNNFTIFLKANLISILCTVVCFLFYHDNIYSIGISSSVGYIVGFAILLSYLKNDFVFFGNVFNPQIFSLIKQYPKMFIIFGSLGLLLATDRFFLGYYETGNIAILQYCIMIVSIPYSLTKFEDIFLTRILHKKRIKVSFDIVLNVVLILAFPMILFVQLNSELIVSTLFSFGKFSASEVERTASVLKILSWQILPLILWPLTYKILQFRGRQTELIKLLIFCIFLNVFFNYLVVFVFGLPVEAVFMVTVLIQFILIAGGLRLVDPSYWVGNKPKYFVKMIVSNCACIGLLNLVTLYFYFSRYSLLALSLVAIGAMVSITLSYNQTAKRVFNLFLIKRHE